MFARFLVSWFNDWCSGVGEYMSLPTCTFKCLWMGSVCLNVFYLGSPGFSFVILVFVTKAFGCVGITFPMSDVPGITRLENSSMNCFFCIFFWAKYPANSEIIHGFVRSGRMRRRVWWWWADGWGRAFMECCLGRGTGLGEGIGGERWNSISSMGLGRVVIEVCSGGFICGGCCTCGSRPKNDWRMDLMKFMIKERGMQRARNAKVWGMLISKAWMMRNTKNDENTKDKQARNAKSEPTKTMGERATHARIFLSPVLLSTPRGAREQTQLAWRHHHRNHGLSWITTRANTTSEVNGSSLPQDHLTARSSLP